MADRITVNDANGVAVDVSVDDLTTLNGAPTDVHAQRVKAVFGSDGDAQDVDATHPLPVTTAAGTYGYAAGTAAGTVDVPAGARVKRVSVIAGSGGAATVTIAGGATITIPAGGSFDEQIPGDTAAGADVVIGGTVSSYYVGWVA